MTSVWNIKGVVNNRRETLWEFNILSWWHRLNSFMTEENHITWSGSNYIADLVYKYVFINKSYRRCVFPFIYNGTLYKEHKFVHKKNLKTHFKYFDRNPFYLCLSNTRLLARFAPLYKISRNMDFKILFICKPFLY